VVITPFVVIQGIKFTDFGRLPIESMYVTSCYW